MPAFTLGNKSFDTDLIQGPLAGYSCAPFRELFYQFTPPAYCVSEMISAHDVIHKHAPFGRYLYRAPKETTLCYQLSGSKPIEMAHAAKRLAQLGADLIDINCGCPKNKIRKKGAGSALLTNLDLLRKIITQVKLSIDIPVSVKIRVDGLSQEDNNQKVATSIEQAGADCLIVHGRHWQEDYDIPCNYQQIKNIKDSVRIPVIANGDIKDSTSLEKARLLTGCDGFMISRAGCGNPWLYQQLTQATGLISSNERLKAFVQHVEQLALLESEHKAMLQARSLLRYYFRDILSTKTCSTLYSLTTIKTLKKSLTKCLDELESVHIRF